MSNWAERAPFECGFYCFPAFEIRDAKCNHAESAHYDIDGENVGCIICEEDGNDA